jgi:hypothetical protein
MTCQTLTIGGDRMHVNFGPEMVEVVNRLDGKTRWCFTCRTRREFRYIVTAPTEPSYYGPNADIKCSHCKTSDGDLFPGREREWE